MVAPPKYEYFAFGNPLKNQQNKIGIGYQKIISKDELLYFPAESDVQSFDLVSKITSQRKDSEYLSEYEKMLSLAWHYTVRGDTIDAK